MVEAQVVAHLVPENLEREGAVDPGLGGIAPHGAHAPPAAGVAGEAEDLARVVGHVVASRGSRLLGQAGQCRGVADSRR